MGVFRPSADDGAAGLGRGTPLRRRTGRAVLLHRAPTSLSLDIVAHRPPCGCGPQGCGAVRSAFGLDADASALRLHRRTRRAADAHRGAVPADIQVVYRRPPHGVALDGRRHGADGLQQVPRCAGGSLRAGGDPPPPTAASLAIPERGRGPAAARAAPRVAVRPRLGVVRLPPVGPQFGLQTQLRRRVSGQHARRLQPVPRAAVCTGVAEGEAAERRRTGPETAARGFHRLLPALVPAGICAAPVGDRGVFRADLCVVRLRAAPSPHAALCDVGRWRDHRADRAGAARNDLQSAGHPFRGVRQPRELRRHR